MLVMGGMAVEHDGGWLAESRVRRLAYYSVATSGH